MVSNSPYRSKMRRMLVLHVELTSVDMLFDCIPIHVGWQEYPWCIWDITSTKHSSKELLNFEDNSLKRYKLSTDNYLYIKIPISLSWPQFVTWMYLQNKGALIIHQYTNKMKSYLLTKCTYKMNNSLFHRFTYKMNNP